jgi:hypothetical protein
MTKKTPGVRVVDSLKPRSDLEEPRRDSGMLECMPGMGELIVFFLVPLIVLYVTYRIGHRIGKAEGRLQGRDEAAGRNDANAGQTKKWPSP